MVEEIYAKSSEKSGLQPADDSKYDSMATFVREINTVNRRDEFL